MAHATIDRCSRVGNRHFTPSIRDHRHDGGPPLACASSGFASTPRPPSAVRSPQLDTSA